MTFHIVTIFPESIKNYFESSILRRAQKNKLLKIKFYNPRDFIKDKHRTTDSRPYGGGAGMVMKAEPIIKAIQDTRCKTQDTKIILLSPSGKQFDQKMARDWAKKYNHIVLICGHYEGIDARVKKILKAQEISIGPYILTGGELPTAVIIDAVSRQIPGVLGKKESLEENRGIGIPAYTRPEVFKWKGKKYCVPKVLLSGHHKKIDEWRRKHSKNTQNVQG